MAEGEASSKPLRVVDRATFFQTVVLAAIAGFIAGLGSYSVLFAP